MENVLSDGCHLRGYQSLSVFMCVYNKSQIIFFPFSEDESISQSPSMHLATSNKIELM